MEMDSYPTKKSSTNFDKTEDIFEENDDDILISQSKSHRRKKRQAPYLIFPEILCIIDYDGYRYVLFRCQTFTETVFTLMGKTYFQCDCVWQ